MRFLILALIAVASLTAADAKPTREDIAARELTAKVAGSHSRDLAALERGAARLRAFLDGTGQLRTGKTREEAQASLIEVEAKIAALKPRKEAADKAAAKALAASPVVAGK